LIALFNDSLDEIIIRRCSAHGKFINFHTDVSLKTLQVALNDDSEYEGGRLMYLSDGKVHVPSRPAGSITIHHNDIVHGVTKLHSGTRYGLFLLKKTA
jgi:predicted 2-oxoglutarate/Fe(II)-dependent dioxygenase YbiX